MVRSGVSRPGPNRTTRHLCYLAVGPTLTGRGRSARPPLLLRHPVVPTGLGDDALSAARPQCLMGFCDWKVRRLMCRGTSKTQCLNFGPHLQTKFRVDRHFYSQQDCPQVLHTPQITLVFVKSRAPRAIYGHAYLDNVMQTEIRQRCAHVASRVVSHDAAQRAQRAQGAQRAQRASRMNEPAAALDRAGHAAHRRGCREI